MPKPMQKPAFKKAPPQILKTTTVAKSRIFEIEQLDLRFSNGVKTQYERLKGTRNGAVLIVPMLDDDTVLLIREYAAGVQRYELALPKGKVESDEDFLDAANREIMEEVGYAAKSLEHLTTLSIAPGYLSHETHIILAEGLYECRKEGDEPEEIEVIPWKLSEINTLLQEPECTEARSIAALFMTIEIIKQRNST